MFAQTDSDHVMATLSYEKTWEQTLLTVQDKYVRTSWWVDFFSPPQLCINWAWKFFFRVQRVPAIVKYSSFNCRAVSKRSPWLCRKAWRWDCLCSGNFKSLSRFFSFFPQCNHSFLVLNIVQFEKNFPYWDKPAELSPTLGDMLRGSHWDVLSELHTNIFLLNFLSKHSNVMNVGSAFQARLVVQVLSLRGSAIEHDGLISWWKPIRNKPAQTWQINPTKSYARRAYTLRLVMQIQPSSTVIPGLSGCGGLMQWFVRFNENPLLREQIFFPPHERTAKRKVELTTQVRHLWTSQLHRVWHTQNPSRRARKRSAFVGQTPSALWTIPTCGIAEELLSKLRSWEVYLEWGPRFPHPKWSHVVGCSENEVYYAFCVHVWCPQDVGRCLIPSGSWCYNPSINFGRPK